MHACTVITHQRLAHARVMARSFLEHHPGSTVHALLLNPGPGLREGDEPFEILAPGDLFTPQEWGPMWFAYTPAELAYATKPRLMGYLLEHYDDRATYLDSDLRFYQSMDRLERLPAAPAVVLSPHIVRPIPRHQANPNDLTILMAGVYNTGFMSVGREGREFLEWWSQHLESLCLVAGDRGLNGDQRWVDLAPALFDCHILKDPTFNVAYWNLGGRRLDFSEGRFLIDGEPLTFFHFSAYDPHRPWVLTRHNATASEMLLSRSPALRRLCDQYGAELLAAGYDEASLHSLDQNALPGGVVLDERARHTYRAAVTPPDPARRLEGVPNPLTHPDDLVAWLREPADPGHPPWLSRYLHTLYRERQNLSRTFPNVPGPDGDRFLAWVHRRGRSGLGIPEALMPPAGARPPLGLSRRPLGPGINLVGPLQTESGSGEGARQLVAAAQALRVPLATRTWPPPHPDPHQSRGFEDLQPVPGVVNPFDLNLVCLNGPEAQRFGREAGPDFFSGRYTVGYSTWPLAELPASWWRGFGDVDEVWACSEFAAAGIRAHANKPVRVFPLPVGVPQPSSADRGALGLPDGFLFLFVFDYRSTLERKNPVGLVRAFRQAFAPGEGPVLVIKSINEDRSLTKREWLHYEAAGRPDIVLLEGYLSPGDKDALLASCDCYVSLHRSEAFGLAIAEAMALGKPTIATGYSGNLEFMTPENSFLVGFAPGRVPPDARPYPSGAEWAEPDLDEAAQLMRRVYLDPQGARRVGERARADMALRHGPQARARLLEDLLGQARSEGKRRRPAATAAGAPAPARRGKPGARKAGSPEGQAPEAGKRPARPRPPRPAAPPPAGPVEAPNRQVSLPRGQHEELLRAQHDLLRLLRRLGRPPFGWILARQKGYRKLRHRWLDDD